MLKLPDNKIAFLMQEEVEKIIKGVPEIIRLINIALFAQGHILLEGMPGVAKTTLFRVFAKTILGGFSKIEGKPDIMPSDLVLLAEPREEQADSCGVVSSLGICFKRGPLTIHGSDLAIVLIDEINRMQPKTQSAMLCPMQEREVSYGATHIKIPYAIFVATRNPLETEETFELPEAQRDRFMFEGQMGRPSAEVRQALIRDIKFSDLEAMIDCVQPKIRSLSDLQSIRMMIQEKVSLSDQLADYIIRLSDATWQPQEYVSIGDIGMDDDFDFKKIVRAGLSPRAEMMLGRAGRVVAWMKGRDYVIPEDIQEIFLDFCGHRFFLERFAIRRRSGVGREILKVILAKVPSPRAL